MQQPHGMQPEHTSDMQNIGVHQLNSGDIAQQQQDDGGSDSSSDVSEEDVKDEDYVPELEDMGYKHKVQY